MKIREMTIKDYKQVYQLWLDTPNMGLYDYDDSEGSIAKFLDRNPGLCFVAEIEGEIIGVVLSGHDGRRGRIYHLAVSQSAQGNGIGAALVDAVAVALEREGIAMVALVAYTKNEQGNAFWEKHGFKLYEDLVFRSRELNV